METENAPLSEQPSELQPQLKRVSGFKRFTRTLMVMLWIGLIDLVYFWYVLVSGEGVKPGQLNQPDWKGNIFKTYEGKLIQEGFRSQTAGSIQSYEFEFSIKSKKIYEILSANSGKSFDLHYKEYHGAVPWRGNTKYIVDSIVSMRDP